MAALRIVRMRYHREGGTWWAESPDVAGFTAAGSSLEDARKQAHEGIEFFFEEGADEGAAYVLFDLVGTDWEFDSQSLSSTSSPPTAKPRHVLGGAPTFSSMATRSWTRASRPGSEMTDA